MKYILLIAIVILTACKAQKTATNADLSVNMENLTEATEKAAAVKETTTSTEKATTAVIDFVKTEYFPPDSTGQPHVKSVTKGQAVIGSAENKAQQKTEQLNMEATRTDSVKVEAKTKQAKTVAKTPWYDSITAKAGTLCCIALLLWLLFIYLKRKF